MFLVDGLTWCERILSESLLKHVATDSLFGRLCFLPGSSPLCLCRPRGLLLPLITGQPPAAQQQTEFDLSLLTGTFCQNGVCTSGSTQVTDSIIWVAASAATNQAHGRVVLDYFEPSLSLTLIPVVLHSALEALRWLSYYRLPILPMDL